MPAEEGEAEEEGRRRGRGKRGGFAEEGRGETKLMVCRWLVDGGPFWNDVGPRRFVA